MKEKKKSDLAVLLGYTGSYKGLTFLGLGLSAVAMVLGMLPYICIWLVARDLIAVAPNWTEAAGIARYGWMAFGFAASGMMLAGTALGRISEVMSAPVLKITDHPQVPEDNSVEFRDVSFTYAGAVFPALDHVSFKAEPGQTVALVGPSGSGKSTCARLAARLWDIDSGTIRVGGVNIADIDPETLLTDYSMVFQDVVLFDDTVMENIRLGKHPGSPSAGYVYPAVSRDNMFVRTGTYTASIKVFTRSTWDWLEISLRKGDVDYILRHCKNRFQVVSGLDVHIGDVSKTTIR